jgi:hypothetical protein
MVISPFSSRSPALHSETCACSKATFTISNSSLIVTSPSWPQSPSHVAVVGVGVGVLVAVGVSVAVEGGDGVDVALGVGAVAVAVAVCGSVGVGVGGDVADVVGLAD